LRALSNLLAKPIPVLLEYIIIAKYLYVMENGPEPGDTGRNVDEEF
jgi:hypothetical protein